MSTSIKNKATNPYCKPVRKYVQDSWAKHCFFGVKISIRLLLTSLLLLLNSLLPFIPVPRMFRIHDTSHWLGLKSWTRRQDRMKYLR